MCTQDANKGKKVLPGEHTGKQIFLNNMLLGVEKEEEGDKKEGGEGEKEVFYFNQSLYGEADDDLEDLPDTDDDDDSDV